MQYMPKSTTKKYRVLLSVIAAISIFETNLFVPFQVIFFVMKTV